MIESIQLSNFKAIGAAQTVDLRPLTLIFGANNSGKSSILQALLLLKQTLEESESPESTLLTRGSLVDVHSLAMLRHRPAAARGVTMAFRFSGSLGPQLGLARGGGIGVPRDTSQSLKNPWLSFCFDNHEDDVILESCAIGNGSWHHQLAEFTNLLRLQEEPLDRGRVPSIPPARRIGLSSLNEQHAGALIAWDQFVAARERFREAHGPEWKLRGDKESPSYNIAFSDASNRDWLLSLTLPDFIKGIVEVSRHPMTLWHFLPSSPPQSQALWKNHRSSPLQQLDLLDVRSICGGLSRRLRATLKTETEYTGIRHFGKDRYHIYSGGRSDRVGSAGQRAPDILFAEPDVRQRVNDWFARFGIGAELEIHRLEDGKSSSAFFLELVYPDSALRVQLPDAGSGLRQLLPVIIQSVASRGKLIIIEEPETHLHPRLQAQLGDMFVEAVRDNRNQLLIETHSEHLVLRVQRLVRRGVIRAEDVNIVFVRGSSDGARVIPLRLDGDGDFIDEWPEGFFPERLEELF